MAKRVKKEVKAGAKGNASYNSASAKPDYESLLRNFKTTSDIKVQDNLIEQVIGQDQAVKVIRKAASQRRHVLLIGEPGTGKSMLGLGLSELLPKEQVKDILAFPNPNDDNQPLIRTMPPGKGREFVARARLEGAKLFKGQNFLMFALAIVAIFAPWWGLNYFKAEYGIVPAAIMFAAFFIGSMVFLGSFSMFMNMGAKRPDVKVLIPKVIVTNFDQKHAPFMDATGAHAGALLGDVLHDPFQTGGLGTPPHERVVAGMIHKANMGVLFIDEIATLEWTTQQELLTAIQEGRYPITGQSEKSAGAMVRTEPVPCNFILVAAGNYETLKNMHPALRSRIRGYGYEIYMNDNIDDTPENRWKIAVFVAQEIRKDRKIPPFSKEAVDEIIEEARRRAGRKNHLTLRLRDLGGLVRASGDLAKEKGAKVVTKQHVNDAKLYARTLEQQISDKYIEQNKEYRVIVTEGKMVGRVNGLAVLGITPPYSGIILPIVSAVTPGGRQKDVTATGKLGDIAKEAIKNVSAIIKTHFGEDIRDKYDIYVQFLQTYEGVEGDSASIAVATSIISALKKVPVRQDFAMTGSLSVRGEVLPVGGVSSKVEAAIDTGIKNVIVPRSNLNDIIIKKEKLDKVKIIPVDTIADVLKVALDWTGKEAVLGKIAKAK